MLFYSPVLVKDALLLLSALPPTAGGGGGCLKLEEFSSILSANSQVPRINIVHLSHYIS